VKKISTGKAYEKTMSHSPGIVVDGFLFTAGITGRLPSGELPSERMKEQAAQVVRNIKDIIREAGGTVEGIVKISIFVTDIEEYATISDECAELLVNNPASTLLEIARLALPEMKIEIEVIVRL